MMTNYLRLLVVLLLLIIPGYKGVAHTTGTYPIYFYYEGTPKLDGNPRPSRSRSSNNNPFKADFDESNKTLFFSKPSEDEMEYYIYDENNNLVLQGTFMDSCYLLNLRVTVSLGKYSILIIYHNNIYRGVLYLN